MKKTKEEMKRTVKSVTADDLLKSALEAWAKENYHNDPNTVLGEDGLLNRLKKQLIETMLEGEMTHHLGYEKYAAEGINSGNSRNGSDPKTVKTENGVIELTIPRDRNATFEPKIVPKYKRRLGKFDDQVISLYTRGMTQAEIAEHLKEIYNVEVSVELISAITDVVADEVKTWQARRLDEVYPIAYLDALRVKGRHNGQVMTRVIYVVVGVNMAGTKEILGLWACESEGAKFWAGVLNDLKNRGVQDILIACVDGLKGFPEAINAVFPRTEIQLCIVHLIRSSMKQVAYTDMKAVAKDLKPVYTAATVEAAELALNEFDKIWGERYPMVAKSWRSVWGHVVPFFKYPPDIRRAIYTTNAIESVNSSCRHIINNRNLFPSDEAIFKLLFLTLTNAAKKWTMPIKNWARALQQFAIFFEGRVPLPGLATTQNFAD
jgi:putative transposase